jgi:hypothetical protein
MGVFSSKVYIAKAWSSNSKYLTAQDFPETAALPELQAKPSTAIGFSGGGARAMIGTFGCLAGLRDLGLLDKIRYMGGISGGCWGITTYLYGRLTQDDDIFLGPIIDPQDITIDNLKKMDESKSVSCNTIVLLNGFVVYM